MEDFIFYAGFIVSNAFWKLYRVQRVLNNKSNEV